MEPVKPEGNEIDEVETFMYLDSIIDKHGGTDVETCINNFLRRILQIRWPNIISNRDLWEKT